MKANHATRSGRNVSHSVGRKAPVADDKPATSWDSMKPHKKPAPEHVDKARSVIAQTTGTTQPGLNVSSPRAGMLSHSTTTQEFFKRETGNMLPPQYGRNKGRKTLVLDLDETLVHSSFQPVPRQDMVLPIEIEGRQAQIYVLKRPGAEEFIKKASDVYEVIIFTASMPKYANPLLDRLDPKHYVSHRLFREHCTFLGTALVKDLSQLGRDLKDVIIVDNSPTSYLYQPANALPARTWIDDKSDTQLFELLPVLEILAQAHDVREHLKKVVKNDQINCAQALKLLKAEADGQKSLASEPRPPLINAWVPQQGKLTTPPSAQQSQMRPEQSQPRLLPSYRASRADHVMLSRTTKHETAPKFSLNNYLSTVNPKSLAPAAAEKKAPAPATPKEAPKPASPEAAHDASASKSTYLRQKTADQVPPVTPVPTYQRNQYHGTVSRTNGGTSTPMNSSMRCTETHSKISDEKGPAPHYSSLVHTKAGQSPEATKDRERQSRLAHSSSTENCRGKNTSYSVERVRRELKFDATPSRKEDRLGTTGPINLLGAKRPDGVSSPSTRLYTSSEYTTTASKQGAMAKTATAGFHAWPERISGVAKEGSLRDSVSASSRAYIVSRTVPYSGGRTGYHYYY